MTAIQVLVGLAALYSVLSIACSAIQETLAALFARRGANLRATITTLFGGKGAGGAVSALFDHPLVRGAKFGGRDPTCIDPRAFADAVLDLTRVGASEPPKAAGAPERAAAPAPPSVLTEFVGTVRRTIEGDVERGGGDAKLAAPSEPSLAEMRARLERIYEATVEAMRASYARRTKLWLFLIGTLVAGIVNADTLRVTRELSRDPAAATAAAEAALKFAEAEAGRARSAAPPSEPKAAAAAAPVAEPKAVLEALRDNARMLDATGLRLGWDMEPERSAGGWFLRVVGFLITGCALSMGGPFWFDLLSKLMPKRSPT